MSEPYGFRVRLRVIVGKPLTSEQSSLSLPLDGREVTMESGKRNQPLSESFWIVLGARGFNTEAEAWAFGEKLSFTFGLAAMCSMLGTDVGQDKATTHVNESFARSIGLIAEMPSIHGLAVYPDHGSIGFSVAEAIGKATFDPRTLSGTMSEIAGQVPKNFKSLASSIRLLNLAFLATHPLSQVALALSAVESLGQAESWSDSQKKFLEKLAREAELTDAIGIAEKKEIADVIRNGTHKIGIRQGIKRVLSELDIGGCIDEWDRIYKIRSNVFHGTVELSKHEIQQLGFDSMRLCAVIVLARCEADGIKAPTIAQSNFGTVVGWKVGK